MASLIDPRNPDTLTQKWRRLLQIQTHAIATVQRAGQFERLAELGPILVWQGHGLTIHYKTPFQQFREHDLAAKALGLPPMPAFALNIWEDVLPAFKIVPIPGAKPIDELQFRWQQVSGHRLRKVLNVGWSDDGSALDVMTFRRGDWEDRLMSIALQSLRAGPQAGSK